MKLVLLRHGLAVDREEFILQNKEDSQRPLVAKGKERTKLASEWLKKQGLLFDFIVTSPYVRARQTADIVAKQMGISNVFEAKELVPHATMQSFANWLQIHGEDCEAVLAVGHDPHMSHFASWCLNGADESFIDLKKSGLIGLEFNSSQQVSSGRAQLHFLITPKMMNNF